VLNRTYQEMAQHYHTTLMPTRAGKPTDYPQKHIILKNSENHCYGGKSTF